MIRIEQTAPVQSKFNGKWACTFTNTRIDNGKEHVATQLETAALWPDAATATQAGKRVIEILEKTGKYPNMCEAW